MKDNRKRIKRITLLALFASVAMLLSYVEFLLPPIFTSVPGIKMGLPNIIIVLVLYRFGIKDAAIVSLVKLVLSTMLFANITAFWYSLAGAALSLAVMALLKRLDILSSVGVSVAGAVMHNLGQVIVAMLLMQTSAIGYYMIVLLFTGVISGVFIGLAGAMMIKRTAHFDM